MDEHPEGITTRPGDDRRAPSVPCRGHRDIGRAPTQKPAERLHVLQACAELQWIQVDPHPTNVEHVKRGSP